MQYGAQIKADELWTLNLIISEQKTSQFSRNMNIFFQNFFKLPLNLPPKTPSSRSSHSPPLPYFSPHVHPPSYYFLNPARYKKQNVCRRVRFFSTKKKFKKPQKKDFFSRTLFYHNFSVLGLPPIPKCELLLFFFLFLKSWIDSITFLLIFTCNSAPFSYWTFFFWYPDLPFHPLRHP